jgi:octaprenyl-diphosphate synthase
LNCRGAGRGERLFLDSAVDATAATTATRFCCNFERVPLTTREPPLYSRFVEVFARTGPSRADISATAPTLASLVRVAQLVQPQLEEVEARIAKQASEFDPAIEGYVAYAMGGRGKRLRPLLALLAGGASGNLNSGHVDLAVIVELIHVATLVHDDIMDEAERRRSQPTVNARWGNSLSVLLGDCLFAHALNLSTNFENSAIGRAIARTATTVCSGEMIQTQRRFDLKLTVEDYLRIVEMKTGSLFSAAGELAATISEAEPGVIEIFKTFGMQVGTAYQIYDDCLDLAGSESVTGKTLGTDLRKGKFTLPVLIFLQSASEFERERCCRLVLEEKCEEMAAILKNGATNGALNESVAAGGDLIRQAQATLEAVPPNPYTDALFALGDALREMFDQLRV